MDDVNNIKIDITLEQLSKISAALYLWNLPTVKFAVQAAFAGCFRPNECFSDAAEKKWPQIIKLIMSHLSQSQLLGKVMQNDLQEVVISIGEKLLIWGNYVLLDLRLSPRFLENIPWTSYGAILQADTKTKPSRNETIMILTENWLKFRNFFYAWLFNQEKIFNDNLKDILEVLKKLCGTNPISDKTDMHSIIEQWLSHYRKLFESDSECEDEDLLRIISDLPFDSCGDWYTVLFLDCREWPFAKSVAYLQTKLRENKEEVLREALRKSLVQSHRRELQRDALARTFLFLINKSSGEEKLSFIAKYLCEICQVFCTLWPYRDLILQLISIVGKYSKQFNFKINYEQLIDLISSSLKKDLKSQNDQKTNLFVKILNEIFKIMSKHEKKEMLIKKPILDYCLFVRILKLRNYRIIEAICADPDVTEFKNELIDGSQTTHFLKEAMAKEWKPRSPNYEDIYFFLDAV